MTRKKPLTTDEIKLIRQRLSDQRKVCEADKADLEIDILELSGEAAGEISRIRTHPADLGSIEGEKEESLVLIERLSSEIRELAEAEDRISFASYGTCQVCKKDIPVSRLMAIPETQVCGTCKLFQELDEQRHRRIARTMEESVPEPTPESQEFEDLHE